MNYGQCVKYIKAKVRKRSSVAKTGANDVVFSELVLLKTYPNPSALQFFDLLVKIICQVALYKNAKK